ncbi:MULTISPECIES: Na+/H+ antiporter NhaA [unclassified Francisella]|uniref:Na+/H+ antiporter NhaA n=1 Tax=unclassified Francisella TaxID=2610885 RepID=UPI002E32D2E1|nr:MULTISPECIES: Na+/H+ antiporter NhaA [unclassified Francisella]MED7819397.1 Na+/H+ antiporter NhaA [Francisella sp. 19S2-4]MED7830146.1 Na+/H+ antiporter NhaA [Francisella sp. 19S2-10]
MSVNSNNQEIIGGIILFSAAILAIFVNNSPLSLYYGMLDTVNVKLGVENLVIDKSLTHWINDGLMAIYFLYIGLEIKREVITGVLSKPSNIITPAIAAFTGLILPSLIYLLINFDNPHILDGWAIPSATDIAFTLGILALLGTRVPAKLKLLVVTIAIFDDIAAIVIIAFFYSKSLSLISLSLGLLFIFMMIFCSLVLRINRASIYVVLGFLAWFCTIKSGVHATLAGFVTALCIPYRDGDKDSPAKFMEDSLYPWVIYFILPIFAFANAGINFSGISFSIIFEPLTLGIILGLFVGKQIGIFSILALFKKLKIFKLGESFSNMQLYGVSILCGIGFTMSLFIGTLAFNDSHLLNSIKIGVIIGSVLSGLTGYIVLRFFATISK